MKNVKLEFGVRKSYVESSPMKHRTDMLTILLFGNLGNQVLMRVRVIKLIYEIFVVVINSSISQVLLIRILNCVSNNDVTISGSISCKYTLSAKRTPTDA